MSLVLNGSGIVSSNIVDGTLVDADISTATVKTLKSGRKNLIINGGFDVWQRGTSFTMANADQYHTDRWYGYYAGTTISQVTETHEGTKIKALKIDSTGATVKPWTGHKIEGSSWCSNKTVTISFLVKSTSSFSDMRVSYNVLNGSGSTLATATLTTTMPVTTSFIKQSITTTIADLSAHTLDDAGSCFALYIDKYSSSAADFTIAQVQLELGSVATDFEHRSYGEELALCQRYYQRYLPTATSLSIGRGYCGINGHCIGNFQFPVMRTTPTFSSGQAHAGCVGDVTLSSVSMNNGSIGYFYASSNVAAEYYVKVASLTLDAELY